MLAIGRGMLIAFDIYDIEAHMYRPGGNVERCRVKVTGKRVFGGRRSVSDTGHLPVAFPSTTVSPMHREVDVINCRVSVISRIALRGKVNDAANNLPVGRIHPFSPWSKEPSTWTISPG